MIIPSITKLDVRKSKRAWIIKTRSLRPSLYLSIFYVVMAQPYCTT